jgi:AraC family transcriptional regulator of adaptative response/methylated-DNA-[protein]-cysteine methyltransferase
MAVRKQMIHMGAQPSDSAQSPDQVALVADLCRYITASVGVPTLADLGQQAGLSPFHVQRIFKAVTGVTPKVYAQAQRAERVRHALVHEGTSVTDAFYAAGYGSNGRFYEDADRVLGMTPTAFKAGGAQQTLYVAVGQCVLGAILVAQSARGVCAILMDEDPQALMADVQDRFPHAQLVAGDAAFEATVAQVVGLVAHPRRGLDLPLDLQGTAFQVRVWQALRGIPPGQTVSYAQLAERIGSPKAVRAVAGACAANPLAVAVPCHRVVRTDGSLSGYRWGVDRKRALLLMERAGSDEDLTGCSGR